MTRRWQDWVVAVAGVWLIISPWILRFTSDRTVLWTFVLVGVAIGAVALFAVTNPKALGTEWVNVILGLFALASPWLIRFTDVPAARWNAVIMGIVVAILAAWALMDTQRGGGRKAMG